MTASPADFLGQLAPDQRAALLGLARRTTLRHGEFVFRVGDAKQGTFLLISGRLKFFRETPDGRVGAAVEHHVLAGFAQFGIEVLDHVIGERGFRRRLRGFGDRRGVRHGGCGGVGFGRSRGVRMCRLAASVVVRGRGAAYETSWHQTTVAQRRASLDGVDVTVRRLGLVAYLEAWDESAVSGTSGAPGKSSTGISVANASKSAAVPTARMRSPSINTAP